MEQHRAKISTLGLGETVDPGTNGALKRPREGSKLSRSLSAIETRSLLAEIKKYLGQRVPDEEIAEKLCLTAGRYNDLKKELYRQEIASLQSLTTEDVFLEYKWQQGECIGALDKMITAIGSDTKQHNALVGAIKARSEIIDKVIKTGQDMGVIQKAPETRLVVHGHALTSLSDAQLRKLVVTDLQGLGSLVEKYGMRDMSGKLLTDGGEDEAGPSFTGPGRPGLAQAGAGKAAAARASRATVKRSKVIDVPG